jgi:hypothetical protein
LGEKTTLTTEKKANKRKNWMIVFILIGNISRYLSFLDAEQLPSEITPDKMVGTHPRSTGVPVIHHQMKTRLKTLASIVI